MSFIPNIFVVGEISSGKSSFLNALASGFISCVSLQRETFSPLHYEFRKSATEDDLNKITNTLQQIHTNNQKQREQLNSPNETKLDQIDPIIKYKLPSRYGLNDINVIDFPGLNDSEDKENKFMKVLEENIHNAHVIMFITDAEKAFSNASELETYKKIKTCIDDEFKKNYHHVELLIVVNKYDEIKDVDIRQIYERIPGKVNVPMGNLFRISSHKLFVNSIVNRKGHMVIPKFLKTESQKILKNSNVSMSGLSKKFSAKISTWVINYSDLNISDLIDSSCSDDDSVETINYIVTGDWDNLIEYIREFDELYIDRCHDILMESINDICKDIYKSYVTMYNSIFINFATFVRPTEHITLESYISELLIHISRLSNSIEQIKILNIPLDEVYIKLLKLVELILHHLDRCAYTGPHRLLAIEVLFNMIPDITFKFNVLKCIINSKSLDTISTTTILFILHGTSSHKLCMQKIWDMPNGRKKILDLLSDPVSYTNKILLSSDNCDYIYNGITIVKTHFTDENKELNMNWFISRLATSSYIPTELKYTVIIAITSTITLQHMYINHMLNIKRLNGCQADLALKLQLYLCKHSRLNNSEDTILGHKLFTLDNVMHDRYTKTQLLLKDL